MSKKMIPSICVGISGWNYGHWEYIFPHHLFLITLANNYINPVIPEKSGIRLRHWMSDQVRMTIACLIAGLIIYKYPTTIKVHPVDAYFLVINRRVIFVDTEPFRWYSISVSDLYGFY
jgi:hypothetical protein